MPPYMKYFVDHRNPEILKIAENELGETERIRTKCLEEIKELIQEEHEFHPCLDDVFLLKFLRQKKFQVVAAFQAMKKYYKFKARYSGIVSDLKPSKLKAVFDQCYFSVLEHRDNNHVGIIIARLGEFDMKRFTVDEITAAAATFVQMLTEVEATQVVGYSMIFDCTGLTWEIARQFASPANLYRFAKIIQDYIPCRIKSYHMINEPVYIHWMFKIASRFMSKKIAERFQFHGYELSSLHQQVPRDILPQELGGTQGPIAICAEEGNCKLMKYEKRMIELYQYGYQGKTLEYLRN